MIWWIMSADGLVTTEKTCSDWILSQLTEASHLAV